MKKPLKNPFLVHALVVLAASIIAPMNASAQTSLFWDANGETAGTGGGTAATPWDTTSQRWRDGSSTGTLQAWVDGSNPVFSGTAGTVTLGATFNPTVSRLTLAIASGNYSIGASPGQGILSFNGSYDDSNPAIDSSANTGPASTSINSKITGTLTGGLVIKDGNIGEGPGARVYLNATSGHDFIGDLIVLSGNLHMFSNLGDAANKIILKGGGLYGNSGVAINYNVTRDIVVANDSHIYNAPGRATGQVMSLANGKTITGTGNLSVNQVIPNQATWAGEVRFQGDMSGYSGTITNRNGTLTIQSTAASTGAWIVNGGTLKLDTIDDTHIANGSGKSNLIINGGTLDLNGKSETINGLSGPSGSVINSLTDTTSTLTVGDNNANAVFGGTLSNGAGTLALTKIGSGTQTIGNANHSGATLVSTGTLATTGSMAASAITVSTGASFVVTSPGRDIGALMLENGSKFSAPLPSLGSSNYLLVKDMLTLANGGTITLVPTFSEAPELGIYDFIATDQGISGNGSIVVDFSANGPTRVSGTGQSDGSIVAVNVVSLGGNLVWNNGANNGAWSVDGDANFLIGAAPDKFLQYDNVTFGPASPAGTIQLAGTLLPASVTVNSSENFTFAGSGRIAGSASFSKTGSGTLTLDNNNSNSGDTTVAAGSLIVNGTLGSGDLTVNPGATLAGIGTSGGPAFINGNVAPGNGIGTITLGATVLTGTYQCDLAGDQADVLAVTGNLNLTGSTFALNLISPPTKSSHLIATYTGSLTGTFASAPTGYVFDTSVPGRVFLWQESATLPPAGAITFEQDQGYPAAGGSIAIVDAGINTNLPFDGVNGWSRSSSNAAATNRATGSSGEYFGGLAIGAPNANTYIGAKLGSIAVTGANTIAFDAPFFGGTQVGLFMDLDEDGLFDGGTETGMSFGIGGSPARFQYRNAAFTTENFGPGFTGIAGHWYRFAITIGESIGSQRSISMAVRNLTTGEDYDFDATAEGVQPWSFTVTDTQFGFAPELADGMFVRTTGSARIDNLRVTSVAPPAGAGFAEWALANGVTGGINGDHDNDGVVNGIEFFMGESGSGFTAMPALGADRKITWTMGNDYTGTYGPTADYVLETSTTLAGWTPVPAGQVQFNGKDISYTLSADEGIIFVRLNVMGPQ